MIKYFFKNKKIEQRNRYEIGVPIEDPLAYLNALSGENWTSEFAQEIIEDIYKVVRGELEETEISDNYGAIICLEVHKEKTDVIALSMSGEEFLYSIPTSEILKLMEDFRDFLISQEV